MSRQSAPDHTRTAPSHGSRTIQRDHPTGCSQQLPARTRTRSRRSGCPSLRKCSPRTSAGTSRDSIATPTRVRTALAEQPPDASAVSISARTTRTAADKRCSNVPPRPVTRECPILPGDFPIQECSSSSNNTEAPMRATCSSRCCTRRQTTPKRQQSKSSNSTAEKCAAPSADRNP